MTKRGEPIAHIIPCRRQAQEILRIQTELCVVVHGGTVDPDQNLELALREAALASGVGIWTPR